MLRQQYRELSTLGDHQSSVCTRNIEYIIQCILLYTDRSREYFKISGVVSVASMFSV